MKPWGPDSTAWPQIERHPRIVVDTLDYLWESMVRRLLSEGRPFTVVMGNSR